MQWSRAIVVGASSGIGAAMVRQLSSDGTKVVAVARRVEELEKQAVDGPEGLIIPVGHDVLDVEAVPLLFEQACAALGGLDLIVYAAGVMPGIGPDVFDSSADRTAIAVNLTGAVAWLNEAAARFSTAGAGTIVGIGSMAGERGRRGAPAYGAAKAGLHTYLESLRNRLAVKGVSVVTAKPGFVDTEMTKGLPGLFWLISADEAAEQILRAASNRSVTVYVPGRWRMVSLVVRSIPSIVFRRLPI